MWQIKLEYGDYFLHFVRPFILSLLAVNSASENDMMNITFPGSQYQNNTLL